ncbi:hypothetical protein BDB01DRAFT_773394 [Pilobolus umbonatus]|nr:hypothetical protein BDB01DRAFT_773394 [Pilobolus umbonatus]
MDNSTYSTPDKRYATVAERNGSLLHTDTSDIHTLEDLTETSTPFYPSIQIKASTIEEPDYVNTNDSVMTSTMADVNQYIHNLWKTNCSSIEQTAIYKTVKKAHEYITEHYLQNPDYITCSSRFIDKADFISDIAWHPQRDLIAVGSNNVVFIYEKVDLKWRCCILNDTHMQHITCLEWKFRSAATLAVGCKKGVCVWTLGSNSSLPVDEQPKLHSDATMRYLAYPDQDYISSLAWDPTPGSHLLAVVSATSNILVIHDILLNETKALKRYGKGSIILKWSHNGEWLFEGGASNTSRMWDTRDWTSQLITNPSGLYVKCACWSPDNRTLFYSMAHKSELYMLFLSGPNVTSDIWNVKVLNTSPTTLTTNTGGQTEVGGVIGDISIDKKNGQRLAIAYEDSELIALFVLKQASPLNLRPEQILFPIGYIRGAESLYTEGGLSITPLKDTYPTKILFSPSYKEGALLAIVWSNGMITFVTHTFTTNEDLRTRYKQ